VALSDDLVKIIDKSKNQLSKVYEKLDPENYTKFYQQIWGIRADMEFIVISLKLLNKLDAKAIGEKWKEEFKETLKQVRAERKIRLVFLETLELYNSLESIEDIIKFYKICWKIKEKMTILLNVVKPKHKRQTNDDKKAKNEGEKTK